MADGIFYTLGLRTGAFTGPLNAAQGLVGRFQSSMTSMAAKAVAVAAPVVGLGAGFVALKKAITAAADMESTEAAFTSVLGSAKDAKEVLGEISSLAASTPYGFIELAQSARALFGSTERAEIIPTLLMIGDLASAAQKPVDELAAMYSKIKGGNKVQGEDLDMIADALGGKALQEFVKVLGVDSVGAVRQLGSEGKITGAALQQVFINLTSKGGMAFEAMKLQAETFNGKMSTLTDSVQAIFRIIGQPINDFLRPMLDASIAKVDRLGGAISAMLKLAKGAREQGNLGEFMAAGLVLGFKEGVNILSGGIRGSVAYLYETLPGIFSAMGAGLRESGMLEVMEQFLNSIFLKMEAGLMRVFSNLPGLGGLEQEAYWKQFEGERQGKFAKMNLGALDPQAGILAAGAELIKANEAGMKAYATASAEKIFDTDTDRKKFAEQGLKADAAAWMDFMNNIRGQGAEVKTLGTQTVKTTEAIKALAPAIEKVTKAANQPGGPLPRMDGIERVRGLLNGEDSAAARRARRSAADRNDPDSVTERAAVDADRRRRLDRDRQAAGFRGIRRFDLGPVPPITPGRLTAINDRATDAMGRARGGNPRATKPRELMDGQSRMEMILTKIEAHVARTLSV